MPVFQYEAMNSVGQPVKDEVEATNNDEAVSKIRALGYFPTKIKEKGSRKAASKQALAKASSVTPAAARGRRRVGKVKKKMLTTFTRQLATLIDAGMAILRSLRILEEQQKPGMLRVAIRLVAEDVEGGSMLSEAMAKHPKAFDRLYTNMVRAGELGGVLDVILQRLADFMEKSQALRRKVIGAMIYPAVVITFAFFVVILLLIFIVPKFEDFFESQGGKLPPITQFLLDLSDWIVWPGWLVIIATPISFILLLKLIKTSLAGRRLVDACKLRIPIMGKIVGKSTVARFTRTLGTLLSAGVPILEAITITSNTSGNEVFAQALNKVHDGIRQGENFAEPLRQAKVVDPMVVNMIDVGEETGELDKMLERIADTYDEEVDTLVSSMTSLLEPIIIVVLGSIVCFIVLAIFMPMVSMIGELSK